MRHRIGSPGTHGGSESAVLRDARANDRDFIARLSAEVFGEFGDYGTFLPKYLEHPGIFTTVCEEAGRPAGFVMVALVVSQEPMVRPDGPGEVRPPQGRGGTRSESEKEWLDAEVVAVGVQAEHQSLGIGSRLMHHALQFADNYRRTSGVRSIQLNVAYTNYRALRFFSQLGFRVINADDGTYPLGQRSIRMARLL